MPSGMKLMGDTERKEMGLILERTTIHDGRFTALEAEWNQQVTSLGEGIEEYESALMAHARQIVAEPKPDPKYGIFVLRDDGSEGAAPSYKGIVHINHAWPGTSHATLRMVWIVLAPKFDFSDPDPNEIAAITEGFLFGGLKAAENDMKSYALKMHLGSAVDRSYALALARGLQQNAPALKAAVRGNWLHLDNLIEG